MENNTLEPASPGMLLLEEFLQPMEISQNQLAKSLGIPPSRVNDIIKGKRSVSADTALRLGLYFNMSAEFWLNAQMDYDLRIARRNLPTIKKQVQTKAA